MSLVRFVIKFLSRFFRWKENGMRDLSHRCVCCGPDGRTQVLSCEVPVIPPLCSSHHGSQFCLS